MNIKLIPAYIKSAYYGGRFYAKKYSPEICLGGSIVTGIACAVTTGIASAKVKSIVDEHKEAVRTIRETAGNEEGKQLTKTYLKTGYKLAKLYAVPVMLGTTSVTLQLSSHGIMKKRNAVLATMAAAAENKFEEYRKNVVEKFGEEVDQELAGNYVEKLVEKQHVDPETGSVTTSAETTKEWTGYSQWARLFGPGSVGWEDPNSVGPGGNLTYIMLAENSLNAQLKYHHGYLFMNDIYTYLHYPLVAEGWDYGILWDPNGPEKQFDFGLRRKYNENGAKFLNCQEDSVWLDFQNVQYIKDKVLAKNADVLMAIRNSQQNEVKYL